MAGNRTGLGDTLEQVAAFRVDLDALMGYADAAHNGIVERVSKLTREQFEEPIEYVPGLAVRPGEPWLASWKTPLSIPGRLTIYAV